MSDAKSPVNATASNPNWNGAPMTLAQYDSAQMPQTPNGSTVLAYQNSSGMNNFGKLSVTSGGTSNFYDVQPLANAPSLVVKNWGASNLKLTNLSPNASTPIWIEMFGPGITGQPAPTTITANTPPISVAPGAIVVGTASPNNMLLNLVSNTNNLTIIALIGGPGDGSGNNASVYALNYGGGGTPPGYTVATSANSYAVNFNWGSSSIYIANMSPSTAAPVNINLLSL